HGHQTVGVNVSPRDPPAPPMASVEHRHFAAAVNAAVLAGKTQRPNVSQYRGSKVPTQNVHTPNQRLRPRTAVHREDQAKKTREVVKFSFRRPVRLRGGPSSEST
ncbi:unnamed protein product, partial [Ectocarpus sp. 8 AP-2014]